jgi:two-component system, sensor histidine kinase
MKRLGIRARVLLAAILPVVTIGLLLAGVFVVVEVADLDSAHRQRTFALARQLASTAEFAVFTGNQAALNALLSAAAREQDVTGVSVIGRDGTAIAGSGRVTTDLALLPRSADGIREVTHKLARTVVHPIVASEIPVDDLFRESVRSHGPESQLLGYVVLELTRESLAERERTLLIGGLVTTLAGLLFGCLLAIPLSRGVIRPIVRLSGVVERFGRGDLSARVSTSEASPLAALEAGVNRMAAHIEQSREELKRQVADATNELLLKKEEAEQANAAKSRFLAAASHDLRQPIHALTLLMASLDDEIAGKGRAGYLLGRAQNAIDTVSDMFDALLDISKLDAGVMEKTVRAFPVQVLLSHVETLFTPVALEHGLRFSVVRSTVWVQSDPGLLERLVQNLVSNALKYTASGGVVVGCRRRGTSIAIEVWDTGLGIAAEDQALIFQEFIRLQNSLADRSKGLGIGLAIVERISRLLQHPVRLRSTPGSGSVFSVEVPRAAASVPVVAPGIASVVLDFTGCRVALIDDDGAIRDALSDLLQRWGCNVTSAGSEAALLDALPENSRLDLLICDYRLGGDQSGLKVIEHIRQALRAEVPALLVTGDTAHAPLKEARASGVELLHKPLAPAKLRQVMQRLVGRSQDRPPLPQ